MVDEQRQPKGNRNLANSRINRDGLPAGTPAPLFRLPKVNGGDLALEDYKGQRVLLVFSNPTCGPCNHLAPYLERLYQSKPELQLVMISRGDLESNRVKVVQHKLTFPVVLQRQWEVSRAYGTFATPAAYLIDEEGLIAADVAIGGGAILALGTARGQTTQEQLQSRLVALGQELAKKQAELHRLEHEQAQVRETIARVQGAIRVVEQLVSEGRSGSITQGDKASKRTIPTLSPANHP